jgi:hypothetical protein
MCDDYLNTLRLALKKGPKNVTDIPISIISVYFKMWSGYSRASDGTPRIKLLIVKRHFKSTSRISAAPVLSTDRHIDSD